MKKFGLIFRIVSIIFIIGCCLFYGGRLVYYYDKLKPKKVNGEVVEYIAQTIKRDNGIAYENEGLYMMGSDFVFKGNVKSNYVSYSDKLWRVVKINSDGSIRLVLDSAATASVYSYTDVIYETSEVYNYLINDFSSQLIDSDKYLADFTVCSDIVTDLTNISCDKKIEKQKVGLVSVEDFTGSLLNEKSYFNSESAIWMINSSDEKQMWVVYNSKLSKVSINERYGVRPIIVLNSNVKIKSGEGTNSNPYVLEV